MQRTVSEAVVTRTLEPIKCCNTDHKLTSHKFSSLFKLPISDGTLPSRSFEHKSSSNKFVKRPTSVKMKPENEFHPNDSCSMELRRPNSLGIFARSLSVKYSGTCFANHHTLSYLGPQFVFKYPHFLKMSQISKLRR